MTQRVFDTNNEKDMQDLWNTLPEKIVSIKLYQVSREFWCISDKNEAWYDISDIFSINWHDKTEIHRPLKEATEADIGKLCKGWNGEDEAFILLKGIDDDGYFVDDHCWCWKHCRRLTKQEIEELC